MVLRASRPDGAVAEAADLLARRVRYLSPQLGRGQEELRRSLRHRYGLGEGGPAAQLAVCFGAAAEGLPSLLIGESHQEVRYVWAEPWWEKMKPWAAEEPLLAALLAEGSLPPGAAVPVWVGLDTGGERTYNAECRICQQKGMDSMVKEFKMSQERYDELKKELDYSKTTRADEIAELIKEARGFGDLSENSEYDEAKNEQGKLYSRIAELENILLHAVIVDETDMDSDKVSIGCRVTVTNLDNGKTLPEYTIVGSQEANVMERKVSEDSPFGKALMGSKAGSEITVEAPKGVIRYRVDKIER